MNIENKENNSKGVKLNQVEDALVKNLTSSEVASLAAGDSLLEKKIGDTDLFAAIEQHKYVSHDGNPVFHLNLPYNEDFGKYAENKELLASMLTVLDKVIMPKGKKLYKYSSREKGMVEIGELKPRKLPDGTTKEFYFLHSGATTRGSFVCKEIKITGVANNLRPDRSTDGTDRENDNTKLARSRGNNIFNLLASIGFDMSVCTIPDPLVVSKKDVAEGALPNGLDFEKAPGVLIEFGGIETSYNDEASFDTFGGREIDWTEPFRGFDGKGSMNNFYALYDKTSQVPMTGAWAEWVHQFDTAGDEKTSEKLYKEFFAYVAAQASEEMFATLHHGEEVFANTNEGIVTIARSGEKISFQKPNGQERIYILNGGQAVGKDKDVIGRPVPNGIKVDYDHHKWQQERPEAVAYRGTEAKNDYFLLKQAITEGDASQILVNQQ